MIITPLKVTGSIYRSDQELMWELLIRRFLQGGMYVYTQAHTHTQTHKPISKSHCAAISPHNTMELLLKITSKETQKIGQKQNKKRGKN